MNTNNPRRLSEWLTEAHDEQNQRKASIKAALAESSIPVPDEIYDAVVGLFASDAFEVLCAHPGFELEEKIRSLRTTFELFHRASSDLMAALDVFDQFARRPEFTYRSHKDELAAIESSVRKEIFAFSELAHSLQDHCRRLSGTDWKPACMAEQLTAKFGSDGLHDFVCALRRALHHVSMVEADWLIRNNYLGSITSHYVFHRLELEVVAKDWNSSARRYLEAQPARIDVQIVANSYVPRVRAFYDWLFATVDATIPPKVVDYRRCWNAVQQRATRMQWHLVLTECLKRNIDPCLYLERYLTSAELAEVMRLPNRSSEQVDFIIAAVDEHSACNDEIRSLVYRLFRVPEAKGRSGSHR